MCARAQWAATAARDQGVETFNLLSQVDAVFAAARAATAACGWPVEPPSEAQGWRRVTFSGEGHEQLYPWQTRAFQHASLVATGDAIAAALGTGGDGAEGAAAAQKARAAFAQLRDGGVVVGSDTGTISPEAVSKLHVQALQKLIDKARNGGVPGSGAASPDEAG